MEYKYDAFISYRHLSPDKPIAQKLQTLLETYPGVPKGKKLHLFRDETELPTSNDLGGDIKRALERSRFLVVICSEQFEASKWCMEEVRYFKELHNGSNSNILTLLVGDPDRPPVFPEPLRFENRTVTFEDGTVAAVSEEIEPLAANVSAPTLPKMMKRLKTEFLRIAAPLLGCGFDDLYKRDQRRRTKRKLTLAFGTAGVLAVAALLAVGALLKISAQKREIEENARQIEQDAGIIRENALQIEEKSKKIEEDALELRRNYAQIMLRGSVALEKTGDIYGAIEAAAGSIPTPEDGIDPLNASLEQTAALTGAFEPEIFTACRKLTLQTRINEIYLLGSGKRLLVKGVNNTYLYDVETGELICELPRPNDVCCFCSHRIDRASFTETSWRTDELPDIEKLLEKTERENLDPEGFYSLLKENGYKSGSRSYGDKRLWLMFQKERRNETSVGTDALCVVDKDESAVKRLDPNDGSVLWSAAFESAPSLELTNDRCADLSDGLPVITQEGLIVLDPDTGERIGVLDIAVLLDTAGNEDSAKSVRACNTGSKLVVILDGSVFLIFENHQGRYELLSRGTTGADAMLSGAEVFIRGDTLYAAGFNMKQFFGTNRAFFAGFDVATGEMKWCYDAKTAKLGGVFLGCIEENDEALFDGTAAFAVVFNELFVVNADSGELVSSFTLSGQAEEMHYSENGYVFFIDETGYEIATPLNSLLENILGEEGELDLWFINQFVTGVQAAAYRNNIYAVVGGADNEVCIYYTRTNSSAKTVYSPSLRNGSCVTAVKLNSAGTLAAVRLHDPVSLISDKIEVVDIGTKSVVYSFEARNGEKLIPIDFVGDTDMLAVSVNGVPHIFDANGAEALNLDREMPEQANSFAFVGRTDELVFETDDKKVMSIRPGGEPVPVCDPGRYTQTSGQDILDLICSPSGKWLVVCMPDGLIFCDRENGSESLLDVGVPVSGLPFVWNEDESLLHLFALNKLVSFDPVSGKPLTVIEYDGIGSDIVYACGSLCVLEHTGDLVKISINGNSITREAVVSLGSEFTASGCLSYGSLGNGRGILRHGETAWLIDEEAFEIVYRMDNYCGMNAERNLIFTHSQEKIYSFPIYTAEQLREHALSIIGRSSK